MQQRSILRVSLFCRAEKILKLFVFKTKKFEKMLDKLFFSAIIVKVAKDSRWFLP